MNTESVIAGAALFITLLGTMLGAYVKLMTKIKEIEIKQSMQEKQDDKIMSKLDDIASDISDVKIELQNKQNRQ